MSINVTITAANPAELAEMLQGLLVALPGAAPAPAQTAGTAETTAPKRQSRKNTAADEAPAESTPPAEGTSLEPEVEPPKETTPTVTLEEIRAKLAGLVRAGKQAEVKALFPRFGASKLSEVPEDRLGDLMAEAGKIA